MTNFGYGKVVAVFSAATVTPAPPQKKNLVITVSLSSKFGIVGGQSSFFKSCAIKGSRVEAWWRHWITQSTRHIQTQMTLWSLVRRSCLRSLVMRMIYILSSLFTSSSQELSLLQRRLEYTQADANLIFELYWSFQTSLIAAGFSSSTYLVYEYV